MIFGKPWAVLAPFMSRLATAPAAPTSGPDNIYGTAGDDLLEGLGGNDSIYGYEGADTLNGGGGDDRLYGREGADTLNGGSGDDFLSGDDGAAIGLVEPDEPPRRCGRRTSANNAA